MKINFFGYAFILLLAPSLPQFLPFITFCVIFCKSFALLVCWTVYHRITGHSGVNLFINSRMNSLFNWDLTIKFVVGHNDEVTKLKCNFIKKKCVQRKKLHGFKKYSTYWVWVCCCMKTAECSAVLLLRDTKPIFVIIFDSQKVNIFVIASVGD